MRKYRVLAVSSHPVQYAAPLFRMMARHPQLDLLVAYCSLRGAEPGKDPGFGVEVAWDIPLLDGYPWVLVRNLSPRPGVSRFAGLVNPGLWSLIRKRRFDVVIVYGYAYVGFWFAILAAKFSGSGLILASDATSLAPRDGKRWKTPVKRLLLPWIYGLADVISAPSSGTISFVRSLGIPQDRIFLTHYTVNNEYFKKAAAAASREEIRKSWNVPPDARVVLYCAKLQPWKRPQDSLRAFARANVPRAYLVIAGDGPLRTKLEEEAQALGIADRVRFLGFVNQSKLPGVYVASDLLNLPSEYEPWGLVVNEAMNCGVPAVVSDRVGSGRDLIDGHDTGFVYPVGDLEALANILRQVLPDRERLRLMGDAARQRMETWSFREHIEGLIMAVEKAAQCKERSV